MASWLWPQEFGFFQYLRLKVIVIRFRLLAFLGRKSRMRRLEQLLSPNVRQEHVQIPSRDKGRFIAGDLFYPPGYTTSSPAPVLVNWHGSGFVMPQLGLSTPFSSRVAEEAGIVVLDADYRKAPEYPFPHALEDVEDALRWVGIQARFDSQRIAVSGFSSGGNLSLVAATALRKKLSHLINIPLVISVYPLTDATIPEEKKQASNPVRPISAWGLRVFNDAYCPNKALRSNPTVSPSLADAVDFPDTTAIFIAEHDSLRPEADMLASKLKKNGRKVVYNLFKDVGHAFDSSAIEGTLEWERKEKLTSLSVKLLKQTLCAV